MRRTGIFYHPSFSRRSYLTVGRRLADFPAAMQHILERPNVRYYESPAVSEELLLKVHTPLMVQQVRRDPFCVTAWHSAGGVVQAVAEVALGNLDNAFAFIGAGGHHAGRGYFWGYCCFNDVVLAIVNARERCGVRRFAILDTDAHHGDGTRELIEDDPDILHVCLCGADAVSPDGTKVDVDVYTLAEEGGDMDREYLARVEREFVPRAVAFRPDVTIWYFGFDTHLMDYGSLGLSERCYPRIAEVVIKAAEEASQGRLVVVLGGGSRTDLATAIIPKILQQLAGA